MNKSRNSLIFLILGVALGWTVGIMLAPEKGSEIRKKMSKKIEELKNMIEDITKNFSKKIQNIKSDLENKWKKNKNVNNDKINQIKDEFGT